LEGDVEGRCKSEVQRPKPKEFQNPNGKDIKPQTGRGWRLGTRAGNSHCGYPGESVKGRLGGGGKGEKIILRNTQARLSTGWPLSFRCGGGGGV